MPLFAVGLLLVAACSHSGWNLILKRINGNYISMWWGLAISSLISLPLLFFRPGIPAQTWLFAAASAVFEAAYYGLLATAYQKEDFSLVYPIARGCAPIFLAVWSILFLKETPSAAGVVGLVVLSLGLVIVGSSGWWAARRQNSGSLAGVSLAFLVALMISGYSVIDGAAVKFTDPVAYSVLIFTLTTLLITPLILRQYGWKKLAEEWHSHPIQDGVIGILCLVAYLLVLIVFSIAPVSYTGAMREVSIVIGAIAGWLWLKESFGLQRLIGAVVIFAGILIIVIKG